MNVAPQLCQQLAGGRVLLRSEASRTHRVNVDPQDVLVDRDQASKLMLAVRSSQRRQEETGVTEGIEFANGEVSLEAHLSGVANVVLGYVQFWCGHGGQFTKHDIDASQVTPRVPLQR